MDNEPNLPNLDFDSFLKNTLENADQEASLETLKQVAQERVVATAQENGIALFILVDENQRAASYTAKYDTYKASLYDELFRDFSSNSNLQNEMSFEDYLEQSVETKITKDIANQFFFINIAVATIVAADKYPKAEHTEMKKRNLASAIANGRISSGDGWLKTLNTVIPGDPLDPDNPDDQPYLMEAFEEYANSQKTREFTDQVSRWLEAIFDDILDEPDFEADTSEYLFASLVSLISHHQMNPFQTEARIDETIRNANISPQIAQRLKEIAQKLTEHLQKNIS